MIASMMPEDRFGAYPRNPSGTGYVVEEHERSLEGMALPNFEDPIVRLLEEELRLIIDGLGEAEGRDDLDRGKALVLEGRRAFKTRNLVRAVKDAAHVDLGTHELCDLLRSMGCTSQVVPVDGQATRVWLAPECWHEEEPEVEIHPAQPKPPVGVGGGA